MENEVDNLTFFIDQVAGLIASLSNSMRQMSLGALDLQSLAFSKKRQIEQHIDSIDDLGATIGKLIKFLDILINCYITRHKESADYLKVLHVTSEDDFRKHEDNEGN